LITLDSPSHVSIPYQGPTSSCKSWARAASSAILPYYLGSEDNLLPLDSNLTVAGGDKPRPKQPGRPHENVILRPNSLLSAGPALPGSRFGASARRWPSAGEIPRSAVVGIYSHSACAAPASSRPARLAPDSSSVPHHRQPPILPPDLGFSVPPTLSNSRNHEKQTTWSPARSK